jgi:signal transduction histidine kinase
MARKHRLLTDALLACLLIALSVAYLYMAPEVTSRPPGLITLVLVTSLALTGCRRWPRAVLVVTVCGAATGTLLGYLTAPVAPVFVAIFVVSLRTNRRQAAIATGLTVLILLPAATVLAPRAWPLAQTLALVAWSGLAAAAGEATRSRREYVAAVEERAERAERTREQEAARRVAEERVRIARDLHDAVAHHIALVNAQAGAALFVLDRRPDQARTALGHIQEASRYALDELRATVGLLRQSGDPAAPLEPAPGLDRLADLARGFEPAGLRVEVTLSGRPRTVPPVVDMTAYRIVQEALTNVHKHAAVASARVEVAYRGDRLTITVDNDGADGADGVYRATPGDRAPSERGGASTAAEDGTSSGFGLLGMRERVAVVGGRLDAQPRLEGGFRVTAHLPLHPSGLSARDGAAA